jgi:hypothetical protein
MFKEISETLDFKSTFTRLIAREFIIFIRRGSLKSYKEINVQSVTSTVATRAMKNEVINYSQTTNLEAEETKVIHVIDGGSSFEFDIYNVKP